MERAFLCPVHNDHDASASVNVVKGWWYCYRCGAKGRTDGYIDVDDQRFAEDIDYLLGQEKRVYPESWLDSFTAGGPHPYWLGRGYSPEAIAHFRLGYDWDKGTPCYPIRDTDGSVLGVVRRNPDGVDPKYKYPYGVTKSALLHNYSPQARETVILVEGAPDVWAAWDAGHTAFGLYGAVLHRTQLRLLARVSPRRVVLALDNDRAGREAVEGRRNDDGEYTPGARRLLEAEGYEVVSVDWSSVPAKDLGEADVETRKSLLDPVA